MSHRSTLPFVLAAAFALNGCGGADPAQVQADIDKAQAAGQKMVADAQAKLDRVAAENRKDVVDAQADVNLAAAHADAARPETAPIATPAAPVAKAGAKVADARSDARKKSLDAQYDLDKARAEANYNVAVAHCGSQRGLAEKACKETAKAVYDGNLASAKARKATGLQRG